MRAPDTELPIALDAVTFKVGAVTVLDAVSLNVDAGPPTALIGPNGSGKTTLLRMIMGLIAPSSGRITWGGREASSQKRAIVFQRPAMLRRSAESNIRYALRAANIAANTHDERIAELLGLVGLTSLASRPARSMSGGEQQRLALARALARDPAVLLLDEPTASLDPTSTKAVEDVIAAVAARGVKVVIATHDFGEAKRLAGDVVLMHRGRIVEINDIDRFFTAPKTGEAKKFIAGELLV